LDDLSLRQAMAIVDQLSTYTMRTAATESIKKIGKEERMTNLSTKPLPAKPEMLLGQDGRGHDKQGDIDEPNHGLAADVTRIVIIRRIGRRIHAVTSLEAFSARQSLK
jgi:hypothetical protein